MTSVEDGAIYNPSFYCPITDELMKDPVIDNDGNSYERSAIEEWLSRSATSPITRGPLNASDLKPNRALRSAIEAEIQSGKQLEARRPKAVSSQNAPDPVSDNRKYGGNYVSLNITATPPQFDGDDACEVHVLTSVISPERSIRVPTDICCVVDVSGSMGAEATAAGAESNGLTLLDIVKHAVNTIINTLQDQDRMALVAYSTVGTVIFDLIPMTSEGKTRAFQALSSLTADGVTNLWDGLSKGLDVLKVGSFEARNGCTNAHVLLLTDGVPNVDPPRGYTAMLERYREKCNGKLPASITTFGFGYVLNSALLRELALAGGNSYSFIPDAGMVGTAFVNALGNVMSTGGSDAVLEFQALGTALFTDKPIGSFPQLSWDRQDIMTMNIGDLPIGQSKDFILKLRLPVVYKRGASKNAADAVDPGPYLKATLVYRQAGTNQVETVTELGPPAVASQEEKKDVGEVVAERLAKAEMHAEVMSQLFRLRTYEVLEEAYTTAVKNPTPSTLAVSTNLINALINKIKEWLALDGQRLKGIRNTRGLSKRDGKDPLARIEALLEDLEGQGLSAFSREDWFTKWGKHYILSLARTHQLQQCSNFKDPGVQLYGGKIFREIRDHADEVFISLPPPTPTGYRFQAQQQSYARGVGSHAAAPAAAPPAPVNMRNFNRCDAPCFHGDCLVSLGDGSMKCVRNVRKGDKLLTRMWLGKSAGAGDVDLYEDGVAEVELVLKTEMDKGVADLVALYPVHRAAAGAGSETVRSPLLVTAWHPVMGEKNTWEFPVEASPNACQQLPCDAVFSILLKTESGTKRRGCCVFVNGYAVATLAHGIVGDSVISHAFFGTESVVEALKECPGNGWDAGMVCFRGSCLLREDKKHVDHDKQVNDENDLVRGFLWEKCVV